MIEHSSLIEKRALKASKNGIEVAKQALKRFGMSQTSLKLVKEACTAEGTLRRFWRRIPIQAQTFMSICRALDLCWEQIVDIDFGVPVETRIDWGEAPYIDDSIFYGREEKLMELQKYFLNQPRRLLMLLGLGGIGKTTLAVKSVEQNFDKFKYVIWRSLSNAPLLQELLSDISRFLSEDKETSRNITQLIDKYLRKYKCLIVLDDWEAIMSSGTSAGKYRDGYEDYGILIKRIVEASHQSCLVLISREKPIDIDQEPENCFAIEKLRGLPNEEAQKILTENNLQGSKNDREELVKRYKGNPLALKIVCGNVKTLFNGDISYFLKTTKVFLPDPIFGILDEQLSRLSQIEEKVIYWLAVRRGSVSFSQMRQDILLPVSTDQIINALSSLIERRLLVNIDEEEKCSYKLDPVILKYLTNQMVERIYEEILEVSETKTVENLDIFRSHAIVTSSEGDINTKEEQVRMIVEPIIEKLHTEFRSIQKTDEQMNEILSLIESSDLIQTYAHKNILELISITRAK